MSALKAQMKIGQFQKKNTAMEISIIVEDSNDCKPAVHERLW